MVSKYYGVPASRKTGYKQFEELKEEEGKLTFSGGKYLVLKKQKDGKYKGLYVNYVYENKPKSSYLKIHRFPKKKLNQMI